MPSERRTEVLDDDFIERKAAEKARRRRELIMKSARDEETAKFNPNAQNLCNEPGMDQDV